MKLRLYNNENIELKFYDTFQERLDYINKEIFSNPLYNSYYNISDGKLTKENCQEIENRWLGIKVVNKPHKQEHTKVTLDFISGFLINSTEYSSRKHIKRYYELAKNEDKLNEVEKQELEKLNKNIIYKKKNKGKKEFVFYVNSKAEEFIKKNIKRFEEIENKDYTSKFMLEDLRGRLSVAVYSRIKSVSLKNRIESNKRNKKILLQEIKSKYSLVKKNLDVAKEVIELVQTINRYEEENKYSERQIEKLYDDYVFATEFIQKKD